MEFFKEDVKQLPRLFTGFLLLAFGIYLTKLSLIGMSPWSVFHDGLGKQVNLPFGVMTQLLGLVILLLSIVILKTKVGIGTVFNVLFVGMFIDILDMLYQPVISKMMTQIIVLLIGVVATTFGRSLYISSCLGPGPRDGLFVGLSRITGVQVKIVKPIIEFIVLFFGYLMGGTIGVGTIILVVCSGYMVQFFFGLLGFDPTTSKQSNIKLYFIQK